MIMDLLKKIFKGSSQAAKQKRAAPATRAWRDAAAGTALLVKSSEAEEQGRLKASETMDVLSSDFPGISKEIKDRIVEIMRSSAYARAEAVEDELRKVVLTDFEWPEFDAWCKVFEKNDDWPYFWGDIAYYKEPTDNLSNEDLLDALHRNQLLSLADEYGVKVKKSISKKELVKVLGEPIPSEGRQFVIDTIDRIAFPKYLKAKLFLLGWHLKYCNEYAMKNVKKKYPAYAAKYVRIETLSLSCSVCRKHAGRKLLIADLTRKDLPPFHIGCRCGVEPILLT
jgi:hypothetical protein